MRKFLLLLLIGSLTWIEMQAQPPGAPRRKNSSAPIIKDSSYFMAKRKKMITAGWILLGSGTATFIVGDLIYINNNNPNNIFNDINIIPGTIGIIIGASAVLTSIILFITAENYRLRANSVSFFLKEQDCPRLAQMGVSHHFIPTIGIRISL